jgi:hypothetical protein
MTLRSCAMSVSLILVSACAATAPPASAPASLTVASAGTPAGGTAEAQQDFTKSAARLGYHVVMIKSERNYCKSESTVESHLPKRECLTETQMAARLESGVDAPKGPILPGGVVVRPLPTGH